MILVIFLCVTFGEVHHKDKFPILVCFQTPSLQTFLFFVSKAFKI